MGLPSVSTLPPCLARCICIPNTNAATHVHICLVLHAPGEGCLVSHARSLTRFRFLPYTSSLQCSNAPRTAVSSGGRSSHVKSCVPFAFRYVRLRCTLSGARKALVLAAGDGLIVLRCPVLPGLGTHTHTHTAHRTRAHTPCLHARDHTSPNHHHHHHHRHYLYRVCGAVIRAGSA